MSGAGPEGSPDFPQLGRPDDSLGAAGAAGAVVGFRSTRRGVTGWFAPPQARIIRSLVGQVAELLGPEQAGPDQVGPERAPEYAGPEQAGPEQAGTGPPATGGAPLEGSWDSPEEFAAMLGLSTSTTVPEDPVLARLLPDGYRDDPEAAGEFRKYTEPALRNAKYQVAREMLDTLPEEGGRIQLTRDQAMAWLKALNDVRLALGVRLDITEEFEQDWAKLKPDDPQWSAFEVYAWLGAVQESLVQALN